MAWTVPLFQIRNWGWQFKWIKMISSWDHECMLENQAFKHISEICLLQTSLNWGRVAKNGHQRRCLKKLIVVNQIRHVITAINGLTGHERPVIKVGSDIESHPLLERGASLRLTQINLNQTNTWSISCSLWTRPNCKLIMVIITLASASFLLPKKLFYPLKDGWDEYT